MKKYIPILLLFLGCLHNPEKDKYDEDLIYRTSFTLDTDKLPAKILKTNISEPNGESIFLLLRDHIMSYSEIAKFNVSDTSLTTIFSANINQTIQEFATSDELIIWATVKSENSVLADIHGYDLSLQRLFIIKENIVLGDTGKNYFPLFPVIVSKNVYWL